MSNVYLRNITNSFQDVRLVSLASWRQAAEITPRDRTDLTSSFKKASTRKT
jgi:hypothetical protein